MHATRMLLYCVVLGSDITEVEICCGDIYCTPLRSVDPLARSTILCMLDTVSHDRMNILNNPDLCVPILLCDLQLATRGLERMPNHSNCLYNFGLGMEKVRNGSLNSVKSSPLCEPQNRDPRTHTHLVLSDFWGRNGTLSFVFVGIKYYTWYCRRSLVLFF